MQGPMTSGALYKHSQLVYKTTMCTKEIPEKQNHLNHIVTKIGNLGAFGTEYF